LFPDKIVNRAQNLNDARLSVNEEFRNEIAKTSPILALSEEFNEPLNARMKKRERVCAPPCGGNGIPKIKMKPRKNDHPGYSFERAQWSLVTGVGPLNLLFWQPAPATQLPACTTIFRQRGLVTPACRAEIG
jgi:hypothetical protein